MVPKKPKPLLPFGLTSNQGQSAPRSHGITAQIGCRHSHGNGSPRIQPLRINTSPRVGPDRPTLSGQARPRKWPNGTGSNFRHQILAIRRARSPKHPVSADQPFTTGTSTRLRGTAMPHNSVKNVPNYSESHNRFLCFKYERL